VVKATALKRKKERRVIEEIKDSSSLVPAAPPLVARKQSDTGGAGVS